MEGRLRKRIIKHGKPRISFVPFGETTWCQSCYLADAILENVARFIEKVYSRKRLHSSLGYLPPIEFEEIIKPEIILTSKAA
jgi:transposase InsO family protein